MKGKQNQNKGTGYKKNQLEIRKYTVLNFLMKPQ